MRRNILLAKKKNQKELLKKFKENYAKQQEDKRLNYKDPNKHNPDIPVKYQDNKNIRNKIIKPSGFKIDNQVITEKKDDLNKLLQKTMKERDNKIEITKKPIKKRIISNETKNYQEHKNDIDKLKKIINEKIEQGKKDNDDILSYYQ